MHTAGTWWIFQPKSSEQSTENAPVDISPPAVSQTLCTVQYFWIQFSPVLFSPTCRGGASKFEINIRYPVTNSVSSSTVPQSQGDPKILKRGPKVDRSQSLFYFVPQEKGLI